MEIYKQCKLPPPSDLRIKVIFRAHSFLQQILPNSVSLFPKFRGSPRQILEILWLTAAPILEYTVPTLAQLYTYNFK